MLPKVVEAKSSVLWPISEVFASVPRAYCRVVSMKTIPGGDMMHNPLQYGLHLVLWLLGILWESYCPFLNSLVSHLAGRCFSCLHLGTLFDADNFVCINPAEDLKEMEDCLYYVSLDKQTSIGHETFVFSNFLRNSTEHFSPVLHPHPTLMKPQAHQIWLAPFNRSSFSEVKLNFSHWLRQSTRATNLLPTTLSSMPYLLLR